VLALVYVVGAVYMFVIRPRAAAKPPARPKEERAPVRAPAPAPAQAPARQY
jgi:hypothetical protein